jgi:integrase
VVERREMRILDRDGIGQLLAAAGDRYQPLLATALFTGLRLGELLGLTWADVDLAGGLAKVRKQLDRRGGRPKTERAIRGVEPCPRSREPSRRTRSGNLRSVMHVQTTSSFARQPERRSIIETSSVAGSTSRSSEPGSATSRGFAFTISGTPSRAC